MVKVWDLFIRLNHWLIVGLVVSAWLSSRYGDAEYQWHTLNGYAIFVLVITRIIWGVVGSTTARFSHFIRSPIQSILYLKSLFSPRYTSSLGHNPAGGWMVVLLLLALLMQAVTGMFSSDDISVEGPFAFYVSEDWVERLSGLHRLLFNVIIALVVLHVVAVLYHQVIKKEALIQAMFSGKKVIKNIPQEVNTWVFRSLFFALLLLLSLGGVFWWVLDFYS